MSPIECKCRKCFVSFKINVPEAVENFIIGEELNTNVGYSKDGGIIICPNNHINSYLCCVGDAIQEGVSVFRKIELENMLDGIWKPE